LFEHVVLLELVVRFSFWGRWLPRPRDVLSWTTPYEHLDKESTENSVKYAHNLDNQAIGRILSVDQAGVAAGGYRSRPVKAGWCGRQGASGDQWCNRSAGGSERVLRISACGLIDSDAFELGDSL
jgi:hypothetical protein